MRARIIPISALVVAGALVAAACGGGGGKNNNGGSSTSGLPKCPVNALASAKKPVQITFWHSMQRANEDTIKALTDQFNSSQSDVKVKLVNQQSYKDTLVKFRSGLSSGDLPDIVQMEDTATQVMIDSQAAIPAKSCIEADKYDTSDFLPRVLNFYSVKNVLWPMPFNVSNPVLYYNKKAFAKAGLDPEKPPTSLDEVKADAAKIVQTGAAPSGFAIKLDPWFLEQWLAKAGKEYVNNGNGRESRATKVSFDNPTGLEIFTWLDDMVKSKVAVNTGRPEGNIDHVLAIGNGNTAMTIDTSAFLGTIIKLLATGQFPNVELGVAPMPGPVGKGSVLVGGASLYIMRKSLPEKQAAAWKFAKFLVEPQSQATWAAGTGYVPLRKSAVTMKPLTDTYAEHPEFKIAYDQLVGGVANTATAGPVIGDYQGVRDVIVDAMVAMLSTGKSPKDALSEAATKADAKIADYNSRIGA